MRTFKDYCNLSEEQLRPIEMLLRYVAAEPREFELLLENNANCYLANKSQEEKQRIYAKLAKVKEAFRHAK